MVPTVIRDLALLIARLGIGVVFVAHGWQKVGVNGLAATAAAFDQIGVPLPVLSAWFAALVELLGGIALIIGLAVPVAGALLAVNMLGAYLFVHAGKGLFVDTGGAELVMALGAGSLALAAAGSGRCGLDHLLTPRLRREHGRERRRERVG
ncbi:DoxX family protein [Planomonospora corallina]|uniref:DoxX family protein n=1 Tax=Planomonospora corallina TaxID=1806052 RepID=A0ABV8IHT6_9ACTN